MQFIQSIDVFILNFIGSYCHNHILDRIIPYITYLCNYGTIWILISIILLFNKKYRVAGILTLCALALSTILGNGIIKSIVQRPRPFVTVPSYKIIIKKPITYSFPSGHTAASFAAAFILSRMFKKYKIYFISLASLIAFSRLYLLVHYPSDVFGGIIIGFLSYKIVIFIYKKYLKKQNITVNF